MPRLKTLSEVATIDFVREHAAPEIIPRVLAYEDDVCATERSALGFEWMIMEKLSGDVLKERWESMGWEAKVTLVKTLVDVLAKLYDHSLSGIGNIYPDIANSPFPSDCAWRRSQTVGPIISMLFFWNGRLERGVPRGPFRSSHDWLAACLEVVLSDTAEILGRPVTDDEDSDAEDDREEAEKTKALVERLTRLLPRIFPASDTAEQTVIHHDDLSFHNLLVDESGQLTGIIDWECVSALPLWRACTLPSFLCGRTRDEKPEADMYVKDDNGLPDVLYSEHILEWEQTELRAIFLEEMERVRPEWVHSFRTSGLQNDFYMAVVLCDDELSKKRLERWLDHVEGLGSEGLRGAGYKSLVADFLR